MERKKSTTEVIDFLLRETADTTSSILSQHAQNVISHDELVMKVNRCYINPLGAKIIDANYTHSVKLNGRTRKRTQTRTRTRTQSQATL